MVRRSIACTTVHLNGDVLVATYDNDLTRVYRIASSGSSSTIGDLLNAKDAKISVDVNHLQFAQVGDKVDLRARYPMGQKAAGQALATQITVIGSKPLGEPKKRVLPGTKPGDDEKVEGLLFNYVHFYGSYDYTYASGHSGTSCRAGYSPRKAALVFYLSSAEGAGVEQLYARLGKHTTGKGCLYIKKLADVDLAVLEELLAISWERMNAAYPA